MAQLIATGTAETASADFTLADGASCSIAVFAAAGEGVRGCVASVQAKASNNQYYEVGVVDANAPMQVLASPGTYRVVRKASAQSFGVDKTP